MIFHKKFDVHWFVVLPSIAILLLVALTLGILAMYAGRSGVGQEIAVTPEAVAVRYAAAIETLKRDATAFPDASAVMLKRAEDMLFTLRVPKERLDAHLAAVIQLRALIRALPTMETAEARERFIEILRQL